MNEFQTGGPPASSVPAPSASTPSASTPSASTRPRRSSVGTIVLLLTLVVVAAIAFQLGWWMRSGHDTKRLPEYEVAGTVVAKTDTSFCVLREGVSTTTTVSGWSITSGPSSGEKFQSNPMCAQVVSSSGEVPENGTRVRAQYSWFPSERDYGSSVWAGVVPVP